MLLLFVNTCSFPSRHFLPAFQWTIILKQYTVANNKRAQFNDVQTQEARCGHYTTLWQHVATNHIISQLQSNVTKKEQNASYEYEK